MGSYTQQHICCEQYFSKVTACFINVDQSHYLRVRMSFTGFPDDQPEDGERLTSAASSSNKVKLSTNRRQKEKLMLAAANQKARSVIECSGDLEMLPTEARLSTTPATSSSITSSPVKLKISDDGKCEVLGGAAVWGIHLLNLKLPVTKINPPGQCVDVSQTQS